MHDIRNRFKINKNNVSASAGLFIQQFPFLFHYIPLTFFLYVLLMGRFGTFASSKLLHMWRMFDVW